MALMQVIEEIQKCLDNKKSTVGIIVDFKKAFDKIDHKSVYKNYIIMPSED